MRKTVILVALILTLTAGTLAAVDLLPTLDVTTQQRARYYRAVCYLTGYVETDLAGDPVTDPAAWTNAAAMASHVRAWHRAQALQMVHNAEMRLAQEAITPPVPLEVGE